MKICIVTHTAIKVEGQGRANYEIAKEAVRRGHHVTILAREIDWQLRQHPQVNWIEIAETKLPGQLIRNFAISWQNARWLRQHRQEFDLVNVNGAIALTDADINSVHFVHAAWLRSPAHTFRIRRDLYGLYQWFFTALNAFWEKQSFDRAESIVAVSEKIATEVMETGVAPEKIKVILNGVDTEEFTPNKRSRQSLGLPVDVPLALFVGDIQTNRKNLDTVLKSLVEVPELHLAVVGSTEGSPYPQLANKLNLTSRVHFQGFRRDVDAIMQAVDFLVFPSRYEPFGLVITEAMASGLPVITAQTVGAAELVKPECGIVLSDSEDVKALAAALSELGGDRALREKMGKAARSIAELYSWKNTAQNYLNLFERAIESKNQTTVNQTTASY
ncbi:MAG: glycosyltransferase family 4 protein [Xenococcaceae cyanobacterium]